MASRRRAPPSRLPVRRNRAPSRRPFAAPPHRRCLVACRREEERAGARPPAPRVCERARYGYIDLMSEMSFFDTLVFSLVGPKPSENSAASNA